MSRRPSLTARMADMLDRLAFAMDLIPALVPAPEGWDASAPKPLTPSTNRLRDEARALVAEYRKREGNRG